MDRCESCGHENLNGQTFCGECGMRLPKANAGADMTVSDGILIRSPVDAKQTSASASIGDINVNVSVPDAGAARAAPAHCAVCGFRIDDPELRCPRCREFVHVGCYLSDKRMCKECSAKLAPEPQPPAVATEAHSEALTANPSKPGAPRQASPSEAPSPQVRGRTTLLHQAVQAGDSYQAGLLLSHGAAPDEPDEWGRTPLDYATEAGDSYITSLLLSHGADPNRGTRPSTTLKAKRAFGPIALPLIALFLGLLGVLGIALAVFLSARETPFEMGLRDLEDGELPGAIDHFTRAIEVEPAVFAYMNRGVAYSRSGDSDAAIADFTTAIQLAPDEPLGYFNRGITYDEMGHHDAAISDLTSAIARDPDHVGAYVRRGTARLREGDHDGAFSDFDAAVQIEPGNAGLYCGRGTVLLERGQSTPAIRDFTKAIELDPESGWAYFCRGEAYEAESQLDLAVADLTRAIELDPADVMAYRSRARVYWALGQVDLAEADEKTARDLSDSSG